jgi:hypothetical protein
VRGNEVNSPRPLRLFRAVVLDAYQTRQADARHQVVELDRRLAQLDKRKARLEEAYLYEQAIDRDSYVRHSDRLSEERALLQLGRHDAEIEGLDVEALLNYAEYLALNPGRLWQEAGREQKARLQAFLVPSGITWDGERFGTIASGLFFSRLVADSSNRLELAPPSRPHLEASAPSCESSTPSVVQPRRERRNRPCRTASCGSGLDRTPVPLPERGGRPAHQPCGPLRGAEKGPTALQRAPAAMREADQPHGTRRTWAAQDRGRAGTREGGDLRVASPSRAGARPLTGLRAHGSVRPWPSSGTP